MRRGDAFGNRNGTRRDFLLHRDGSWWRFFRHWLGRCRRRGWGLLGDGQGLRRDSDRRPHSRSDPHRDDLLRGDLLTHENVDAPVDGLLVLVAFLDLWLGAAAGTDDDVGAVETKGTDQPVLHSLCAFA